MTINERFKEIIKTLYNGNKRAFSMKIGVSPTVIENVVGVRNGNPSYEVLHKVCANANINPTWLILEIGDMEMNQKTDMLMEPLETYHKITPEEAQYLESLRETIAVQKELISVLLKQQEQQNQNKE